MRIVVTGALGHIGSRLVRDLPGIFPDAEIVIAAEQRRLDQTEPGPLRAVAVPPQVDFVPVRQPDTEEAGRAVVLESGVEDRRVLPQGDVPEAAGGRPVIVGFPPGNLEVEGEPAGASVHPDAAAAPLRGGAVAEGQDAA